MKVKVSEATLPQLNWMVCLVLGNSPVLNPHRFGSISYGVFDSELGYAIKHYTNDWSQGGPIIEQEKLDVLYMGNGVDEHYWRAEAIGGYTFAEGPTPLVAAMRCFVASKLGDEVEVPEETP